MLANGKNVAPQPIENLLKQSELVQEAVVYGDGMSAPVALIVPNMDALRAFAKQEGIGRTATPCSTTTPCRNGSDRSWSA